MTKLTEDFISNILAIVDEIPYGKVATYGQIAILSGYPKNSRLVGQALKNSKNFGNYPCQRVVNSSGRLVPGWKEQKTLLLAEEISFNTKGLVKIKKHQWKTQ